MSSTWFFNSFKEKSFVTQPTKKKTNNSSKLETRFLSSEVKYLYSQNLEKNLQNENFQNCFNSNKPLQSKKTLQSSQLRKRICNSNNYFLLKTCEFDDLNSTKSVKRRKTNNFITKSNNQNVCEQVAPIEEEDLAIHYKKLKELKQWICEKMSIERGNKTLLLTGPCGCGKTIAVKVLSAELGIEVLEFDCNNQEYELANNGNEIWEKSAIDLFVQFLKSSQSTSIEKMSLKHRLLLIEQLPNSFYRNPQLLYNLLHDFLPSSRCLTVFIMNNIESNWELCPTHLFSTNTLVELNIDCLKFNAISITNMTKAVKRIFSILNLKISGSNAQLVKKIALLADGDIRKATNMIEFYGKNLSLKLSQTIPNSIENMKEKSINNHLEFFHIIGKLMYAKRSEITDQRWINSEKMLLKPLQKKFGRFSQPKDDLNELLNLCFVTGNLLSSYIFEHEPVFAPSIWSLKSVLTNLCTLDACFSKSYQTSFIRNNYEQESTARSVIYYNYHDDTFKPASNRKGLYQFEKPKLKSIVNNQEEMKQTILELFYQTFQRCSDFETLVLPMLSFLNLSYLNKNQIAFIKKIQLFVNNSKTGKTNFQYLNFQSQNLQKPESCQLNLIESDEFNYEIEDV